MEDHLTKRKQEKVERARNRNVSPEFAHAFDRNERIPDDLARATILSIGRFEDSGSTEDGGLVIDYQPVNSPNKKRLVLAFNELAMWIDSHFDL
jgi:hypothetical protein